MFQIWCICKTKWLIYFSFKKRRYEAKVLIKRNLNSMSPAWIARRAPTGSNCVLWSRLCPDQRALHLGEEHLHPEWHCGACPLWRFPWWSRSCSPGLRTLEFLIEPCILSGLLEHSELMGLAYLMFTEILYILLKNN